MNLIIQGQDVELQERCCKGKGCPNRFKVMKKSKQKFCSYYCKYLHNLKICAPNRGLGAVKFLED